MTKMIACFPDLSKRDAYKLTKGSAKRISEISGSIITPEQWALYEDTDAKTGETKTVLSIISEGEKFGTISQTFIREFMDAAEEFDGDVGPIRIITGTTRNNREYVTCELV